MKFLIPFVAAITLVGCTNSQEQHSETSLNDVEQQTEQLADTIEAFTETKRASMEGEMQTQLDKLDADLEAVERQLANESEEIQAKLKPQLKQLNMQRAQLEENLSDAKTASIQSFRKLSDGFEAAAKDVKEGIERAQQEVEHEDNHGS